MLVTILCLFLFLALLCVVFSLFCSACAFASLCSYVWLSSSSPLWITNTLQELFIVGVCQGIGETYQLRTGLHPS